MPFYNLADKKKKERERARNAVLLDWLEGDSMKQTIYDLCNVYRYVCIEGMAKVMHLK